MASDRRSVGRCLVVLHSKAVAPARNRARPRCERGVCVVNKPLPDLSRTLPALVCATVERPTTRDLRAPGHQLLAPMRPFKLLGRSRCTTYHTSAQAIDDATHIAHAQTSQRMIVDPAALRAAWIGRHALQFSAQRSHTTRLRIGEPPIGRCAVAWAGAW